MDSELNRSIPLTVNDLKIRTKHRNVIPFKENEAQLLYARDNPKLLNFRGNREAILKARQLGFSTYIAAKMFIDTITVPNTQSIIIAQDETQSKRIFGMIKRFQDTLPLDRKIKPDNDSSGELVWKSIDSAFYVGWAGSKKVGRGGTINNVHLSEVAFWENAGELVAGLLQAVPEEGNIFAESTANGVDNYFYNEYQSALEGNSVFKPRFYPWYVDPSYSSTSLWNGATFVPTEEEIKIAERFELTEGQLIWRRNKIMELRNARTSGDLETGLFQQEYPSTPDEAFLTTGASYFPVELINNELIPIIKPEIAVEVPVKFNQLRMVNNRDSGRLTFYHRPIAGKQYVVTADPAEGINTSGDADYCSTDVFDFETWEQVCTLYGRWEPHEYAELLSQLGHYYNDALIIVERNNHGHSVLNSLLNSFEYPKMDGCKGVYFHSEYDGKQSTSNKNKKPGYPTNVKTKALALNALLELVSDLSIRINSKRTLTQLKNYSKLPGGKFGASIGHDDAVMSCALGAVVLSDPQITKRISRSGRVKKVVKINSVGQFF